MYPRNVNLFKAPKRGLFVNVSGIQSDFTLTFTLTATETAFGSTSSSTTVTVKCKDGKLTASNTSASNVQRYGTSTMTATASVSNFSIK